MSPFTYSTSDLLVRNPETSELDLAGIEQKLNRWALDADTLALALTEGDYGSDADKAFEDRMNHHRIICQIYVESRPVGSLRDVSDAVSRSLGMIERAFAVDPLPSMEG